VRAHRAAVLGALSLAAAWGSAVTACRPVHAPSLTPTVGAPVIESLSPDTVVVRPGNVVEVVVRGRGFAPGREPGRNTVRVGPVVLAKVPASDDGTELRFVVPMTVPSGGEAPSTPLMPGTYGVRVVTAAGASNTKMLTVRP